MANTPVTGNGPFEFTDTFGRQVSIPLTAFSVDPVKGIVPDAAWAAVFTSSPATAVPAAALLAYAIKQQLIVPAAVPAAVPAVVIKAADTGPAGNNITVQILTGTPASDPSLTTFDIVITEEETYAGLTVETIAGVLGTCDASGTPLTTGTTPGLVRVLTGSAVGTGAPSAVNTTLSGDPGMVEISGHGSPAPSFTLVAKKPGADGELTNIEVTPDTTSPPAGEETFTMFVSWQKEIDGVSITTLQSLVQSDLSYEITVSLPAAGAFSVPAASSVALSGGANGVPASATLFSGA